MFDYLQKFNNLPKDLKESISSPVAMAVISDLEKKYKLDLAAIVMKVMVKIIPLTDLPIYLVSDFSLDQESAKKLTAELKDRLFFSVANYLGYNPSYSKIIPKTSVQPAHYQGVDKIVKDSGIIFPGSELNARFRNIVTTYIKGVRSRIDTRITLNKEISAGGLNLDNKIIDQLFKIADNVIAQKTLNSGTISTPLLSNEESTKNGLDKIRALYEKEEKSRDIPYDLKTAILKGTIKKPVAPLNLPTPQEVSEKLLEEPEETLRLAPVILKNEDKKPTELKNIPKSEVLVLKQEELKKEKPVLSPIKEDIKTEVVQKNNALPVKIKVVSEGAGVALSKATKVVVATAATKEIVDNLKNNSITQADLKPLASSENKIVRPPEKKASFFAKIFHKENNNPVVVNSNPNPPKNVTEVPKSSMAFLRTEAATVNQLKAVERKAPLNQAPSLPNTPKVMGPIEEINYLDLTNFRRLGINPKEAITKVETKIKNLEKEGYDKMVLGVVAWRNGLINSLYLKMVQEALSKGMTLKQLADNYQTEKRTSLLFWEEIEEVISLNNRLMF